MIGTPEMDDSSHFPVRRSAASKEKVLFFSRQGTQMLLKCHHRKLLQGERLWSRRASFPPLTTKGPQIWTLHWIKVKPISSSQESTAPKHSYSAWSQLAWACPSCKDISLWSQAMFQNRLLISQPTKLNQNSKGHFKNPHFPPTQLGQAPLQRVFSNSAAVLEVTARWADFIPHPSSSVKEVWKGWKWETFCLCLFVSTGTVCISK